jgi:hypothetical protein
VNRILNRRRQRQRRKQQQQRATLCFLRVLPFQSMLTGGFSTLIEFAQSGEKLFYV